MPSPEPFLLFTRKLGELGLRYMVSGSVASIYYGEPRLTNDVDIIVFLKREEAPRLAAAFPADEFYCPPPEVIALECAREQRGHFNLIHHQTGFKADIYLAGSDGLHDWGIEHAVEVDLDGDRVSFAPPEYVIVRKLQFHREGGSSKHLRDVARMIVALGEAWDRRELQRPDQ
jgi:hypothetical protein